MDHTVHILIVDDNRLRADSLAFQLDQFGFNNIEKCDTLQSVSPSLHSIIIANIGNEVPKELLNFKVPVILLSSGNKNILQNDKCVLLLKPFHIQKLVDKIIELSGSKSAEIEIFSQIYLNEQQKIITGGSTLNGVRLTDTEIKIIKELVGNLDQGVSKDNILQSALKYNSNIDTHTIETHVYRLRKKLNDLSLDIIQENGKYKLTKR